MNKVIRSYNERELFEVDSGGTKRMWLGLGSDNKTTLVKLSERLNINK